VATLSRIPLSRGNPDFSDFDFVGSEQRTTADQRFGAGTNLLFSRFQTEIGTDGTIPALAGGVITTDDFPHRTTSSFDVFHIL